MAVADLCRAYGISRPTGYRWINRYEDTGPEGLVDHGRRPRSCSHATLEPIENAIDQQSHTATDWFNGKDRMLQESKNTSFSAVGHLSDRAGTTSVTLYENVFAKVKISYEELPACFELRRVEVSTAPLNPPPP